VDGETALWGHDSQGLGNDGAPVSTLGVIGFEPEGDHQGVKGLGHVNGVAALLLGGLREAVPGERRNNDVEGRLGVLRVGELADDLVELEDAAYYNMGVT